jgi:hypothetical protein
MELAIGNLHLLARAFHARLSICSPPDMKLILHYEPRCCASWFGMVGAGKCLNERAKHVPVGAGCLWQASSPYRVLKQVDMRRILLTHSHAHTVHNTSNHSTTSWFGMAGAGKCSNGACKARASRCRLHMASSITISGAQTGGYAPYLAHALTLKYCAQYSRTFKIKLVWDGWSWQMLKRACKARACRCGLPMASSITISGAQTGGYAPYLGDALTLKFCA